MCRIAGVLIGEGATMGGAVRFESRAAARRAVNLPCDLLVAEWDRPIASRCTDLSPVGMYLETSFPVFEDKVVAVCFTPPGCRTELSLFGRVRHVSCVDDDSARDRFGVGLRFAAVTDDERRLLAEALRGLPPRLPVEPARSTIRPVARSDAEPDTVRDPAAALLAASELPPDSAVPDSSRVA